MNYTQSDKEFNETIDEATNAIIAAVNTVLFDKHGKREYTLTEVAVELDAIFDNVKINVTEFYLYGKLGVN